jgi:hypothetical protein
MPVQDAINFAVYILETTIGWTHRKTLPTTGDNLSGSDS